MKRIILAIGLWIAWLPGLPGTATAGTDGSEGVPPAPLEKASPVDRAREHLNVAVMEGRKNNTAGFVQHAEAGLEQLKTAVAQKPSPDLDRAVENLEMAIRQGKAGDANKATERAEAALNNIDAARGAMGG